MPIGKGYLQQQDANSIGMQPRNREKMDKEMT